MGNLSKILYQLSNQKIKPNSTVRHLAHKFVIGIAPTANKTLSQNTAEIIKVRLCGYRYPGNNLEGNTDPQQDFSISQDCQLFLLSRQTDTCLLLLYDSCARVLFFVSLGGFNSSLSLGLSKSLGENFSEHT